MSALLICVLAKSQARKYLALATGLMTYNMGLHGTVTACARTPKSFVKRGTEWTRKIQTNLMRCCQQCSGVFATGEWQAHGLSCCRAAHKANAGPQVDLAKSPPGRSPPRRRCQSGTDPWLTTAIGWDATIAYRRYLWSLGFNVAKAMDTASCGMGLDWPNALGLIRLSVKTARDMMSAICFLRRGHGPACTDTTSVTPLPR